jgi:2-desacetyl-2-hydroxyethyl bacteriochlorophyllide A dehydrogenase
MRAAFVKHLGTAGDIIFDDLPLPEPAPHELRIAVSATTVDAVDTMIRSGAFPTDVTFPFIVGRDAVGTVDAFGADVTGFEVGDRVWTNSLGHDGRQGAAAEYAIVPVERLYRLPDGVGPEAVTVLHPGATAVLAVLRHGGVRAGETVVVIGAAGNVGSAAVVVAANAGAHVVAVADAADEVYCRSLGAQEFVVREDLDVTALPEVDAWIDAAGANDLPRALDALAVRGRIVLLAGPDTTSVLPTGQLYLKDATVTGFTISRATAAELSQASATVDALLSEGVLASRRVERMPLSQTARAHELVEAGALQGARVLLTP